MKRRAKSKPRAPRLQSAAACGVISWVDVAVAVSFRPSASTLWTQESVRVGVEMQAKIFFGGPRRVDINRLLILGPGNTRTAHWLRRKAKKHFSANQLFPPAACCLLPTNVEEISLSNWRTTGHSISSTDPFGTLISSHHLRGLPSYPSFLRLLACVGRPVFSCMLCL